jgi:hypothetical protein
MIDQRYPKPGRNNATVKLGVVPAAGGDTSWISLDPRSYVFDEASKAASAPAGLDLAKQLAARAKEIAELDYYV